MIYLGKCSVKCEKYKSDKIILNGKGGRGMRLVGVGNWYCKE